MKPKPPAWPDGRRLILAPRLDNLASCYAAVCPVQYEAGKSQIAFLADNEEVGSVSMQEQRRSCGFSARLMPENCRQGLFTMLAQSSLLSADAAHALHRIFGSADPAYARNSTAELSSKAMPRCDMPAMHQPGKLLRQCGKSDSCAIFAARSDKGAVPMPALFGAAGHPALDLGSRCGVCTAAGKPPGKETRFLRNF